MFIENLKQLFQNVESIHREDPSQYYFKKGKKIGVVACQSVLKSLKKLNIYDYITREEALPDHPAFRTIYDHIQKIIPYYPEDELQLKCLILRKLLPSNPIPFRDSVLKSMTLRSAIICLNDAKETKEIPIPARIDGYYDFVASIADNDIHISLITDDPNIPAQIPPSIRLIDDKSGSADIKAILIDAAPKVGRSTQFHAFISLLARSNPTSDLMQLFHDSLNSTDLTFAICTCVLAANEPNVVLSLIRILMQDHLFDHFLRSLCCSVRKAVVGTPTTTAIHQPTTPLRSPKYQNAQEEMHPQQYTVRLEMVALANTFVIASEGCWYCAKEVDDISKLIFVVCSLLRHSEGIPKLALYVLRAALTIAAYEDPCGDAAIAMLIELVIQPFVTGRNLDEQLATLKRQIILNPESRKKERKAIEKAIISVLEEEIIVPYEYLQDNSEEENDIEISEKDDLIRIYRFIMENVDPFVRMAIILNSRNYMQSPAVQALMFAFEKSNEIRTLESY